VWGRRRAQAVDQVSVGPAISVVTNAMITIMEKIAATAPQVITDVQHHEFHQSARVHQGTQHQAVAPRLPTKRALSRSTEELARDGHAHDRSAHLPQTDVVQQAVSVRKPVKTKNSGSSSTTATSSTFSMNMLRNLRFGA
jgi:hypothetical protein